VCQGWQSRELRSADPDTQATLREYRTQFGCHGYTESGGRVCARMHRAQSVDADPGVSLRGLQPRMTEHFGHVADIGPAFEHECRHGVTKEVTTPSFLNASLSDVMPH